VTPGGLLMAHGSALILPLAVIEGPLVSVLAGVLAEQGHLAWYWALCMLVCGDLVGDLIYYGLGRAGARLDIHRRVPTALQDRLARNGTKMLFVGKWTHSVGCLVLIGGGMLRMDLTRFLLVNLIATLPKSAVLFGLGYFAGHCYPLLQRHIASETVVLCVAGVTVAALILRRAGGARSDGAGR
jgi:membrane protein DedA with SNARE-associated domain